MRFIAAFFLVSLSAQTQAQLCQSWQAPREVGQLNVDLVDEASGMVASTTHSDRLYWINDSGDKGAFYVSRLDGRDTKRVAIEGFKPRDTEAMTMVTWPDGPHLVIGDIGDNRARRTEISLVFIKESESFSSSVKPTRIFKLKYPDGAHDTEAMTALPNGDILFITKEIKLGFFKPGPAGVYLAAKDQFNSTQKTIKLRKMGNLPLNVWLKDQYSFGQVATDAAVNHQRQVLGILTYQKAVEIPLKNLEKLADAQSWRLGIDYALVPLHVLTQQESMTYLKDEDRVVWSTEQSMQEAPIFSMTCAPVAQ